MSPLRVQGMTLELQFSYKQTFNSQTQAHVYKANRSSHSHTEVEVIFVFRKELK